MCHCEAWGGEGAMAEWGSAATPLKRSIQWVRSSFWGPAAGVGADMMNMNERVRKETLLKECVCSEADTILCRMDASEGIYVTLSATYILQSNNVAVYWHCLIRDIGCLSRCGLQYRHKENSQGMKMKDIANSAKRGAFLEL